MVDVTKLESEVFLKIIGCPHPFGDEKTTIWLEGYKVGMKEGGKIALQAMDNHWKDLGNGD